MKAVVHGSSFQQTPSTSEQTVGVLYTCNACKDNYSSYLGFPLTRLAHAQSKLDVSKVSRYIACFRIVDEGLHTCMVFHLNMFLSIPIVRSLRSLYLEANCRKCNLLLCTLDSTNFFHVPGYFFIFSARVAFIYLCMGWQYWHWHL